MSVEKTFKVVIKDNCGTESACDSFNEAFFKDVLDGFDFELVSFEELQ